MAESENSEAIFGNKDLAKNYPLKNKRDLKTYVILGTPTKKVQVGKHTRTVSLDEIATIRCYLPEVYEQMTHRDFFNKNVNVSYTILNDPTEKSVEVKEESKPKRTRRTREEIAADKLAEEEAVLAAEIAAEEEVNNG